MAKSVIPITSLGKLPAHIAAKAKAAQDAANEYITNTGVSGPRISLRGRRFRLRHPDIEEEHVLREGTEPTMVLVGADPERGTAKVFYMGDYEPDSTTPPDCSAADGITPDGWIQDPQNDVCATCPNNVWGTAKRGKGKACRDVKRLYVLSSNDLGGDIYQLQVPPASLKHLSNYVRDLSRHNVAPQYVVTRVFFEDAEYPIINFKFDGFLDEEQAGIVEARIASGDVKKAVNRGAQEAEPVAEKAAPAPALEPETPYPGWGGGAAKRATPKPEAAAEKPKRRSRKATAKMDEPVEHEPPAEAEVVETDDPELASILKGWAEDK